MGSASKPFAAFCILVAFLDLVPLAWHIKSRNIAVISLSLWLAQGSFFIGLNALFWNGNVDVKFKPYCDITLALHNALDFAAFAAPLCIARQLESIASPRQSANSLYKRYQKHMEITLCVVLPLVYELFTLIVQVNRFYIVEDIGCITETYFSIPDIFICYLPSIIIALATCVYSGLALRSFFRRRAQFNDVLRFSKAGLSKARFLRLIALLLVSAVGSLGLTIFGLVCAFEVEGIRPWLGWDTVHADFDHIFTFTTDSLTLSSRQALWAATANVPVFGALYFLFFGLGGDAFEAYRRWGRWVSKTILRRPVVEDSSDSMTFRSVAAARASASFRSSSSARYLGSEPPATTDSSERHINPIALPIVINITADRVEKREDIEEV